MDQVSNSIYKAPYFTKSKQQIWFKSSLMGFVAYIE